VAVGGKEEVISVDRLKPHLGAGVVPAVPSPRGRPLVQAPPVESGGGGGGHVACEKPASSSDGKSLNS
jgi:hypothetical protein